jgi:hypothetical protein
MAHIMSTRVIKGGIKRKCTVMYVASLKRLIQCEKTNITSTNAPFYNL